MEVVDHDLGLEADRAVVAFDESAQLLVGLVDVKLRIFLHPLGEPVEAGHRRVVGQHVQDEALLDRLLHGVAVEGAAPDRAVGLRVGRAEDLQRLVLRRGGEREVAGVGQQLARRHRPVDAVLEGLAIGLLAGGPQRSRHGRRRAPALAGVRLVDEDGEAPSALLVANLVEDEGKLLDRRDHDLLARLDEAPQVSGPLRAPHRRADLGVLPDGVADLPVEDQPVGDDNDRVEDRGAILLQTDELVRQPRDGVALAAARRVLDQVAPADTVRRGVGQQPAHHVELVVAGPDLRPPLPAGLLVPRLHDLRVVLQNVRQTLAGQHLAPQVVALDAARVGRVARAVVPAPVERQEPGRLPLQMRAETYGAFVHREVGHAAAELEQLLPRIAVLAVLLDRIIDGLLREVVLQFEGEHRQAVDEQPDVERPLRLVAAVAELPDDGEAVLLEALPRPQVSGRRRAVEQVQVVRAVPNAVAQHVDGAALGDLALQPRQELPPRRTVLVQRQ